MEYQTLEDLLPQADWSVYRLVRMASKRALELSDGKKCLLENPQSDKFTTRALAEIRAGRVVCKKVKGELLATKKEEVAKAKKKESAEEEDAEAVAIE